MAGVIHAGVPEDEPASRGAARFRGGSLSLSESGTWRLAIRYEDLDEGVSLTLEDHGKYDRDGEELYFLSDAYGDEFDGTMGGDAVVITYDFDGDGEYESNFLFVD